jgi:predicted nucleic acid-binding protein
MKVVLDASAALAAVLGSEQGPAVLGVLSSASVVMAPEHFTAEVTNSLWKYVVGGHLELESAAEYLEEALQFVDREPATGTLVQEVLREASGRRHPAYDMFYAVLARREGAALLTLDKRLRTVAEAMGITLHP